MMIPSTLLIDGVRWEVKIADLSHDLFGETRVEGCQIMIASRLDGQMRESTLWHEMIHAIFATRGFDRLSSKKLSEEEVASLLGPALFSVLSDNADLNWNKPAATDDNPQG